MIRHNFDAQLQWSQVSGDDPFWDDVYSKAFPDMVSHMACVGDTQSQRLGVDRIIHLASGKTLSIDEKKRRKDRNDILLEFLSNDVTGAPGWIEKQLQIDYLAYAFMPSKRCYLFPWQMLRRAWLQFGNEWKRKFMIPPAKNDGYSTHSVAVPIGVLRAKVNSAHIIDVSDNISNRFL